MKKTFLSDLSPGDQVDDVFVAAEKTVSQKKDGEAFIQLTLADRTGRVRAVVWDNVETIREAFSAGDFIRVSGRASQYRNDLQVVIREVEEMDESGLDPADFLPATDRDTDRMMEGLLALGRSVENPHLLALLESFFSDEKLMARVRAVPAAKFMHHAHLGGLVEHTLSVARLADMVARHYKGLDRDLLLTGAILHDIGKVEEFTMAGAIEYSDKGRLLGHIIIGSRMLDERLAHIPDFPEDLADLVRHILVSHHGLREFGSPEPPKTLEAVALNILDDLDAKVTGIRHFMENSDPENAWTAFHKLMERPFFQGKRAKGDTNA